MGMGLSLEFAGKKVLVAGCAGFLGSNLVDRLLNQGATVYGIDNFSTGSRANLISAANSHAFTFIEGDIVVPLKIEADVIFNLACPASPPHYQRDPIQTLKTSVIGTLNLLELATINRATMVHASTSEVYGDPSEHPQRESYWGNVNPIGVRACYDEGKRAAETLCFDFRRTQRTDVRVVRIFNTYGPRMSAEDGRVVSNFIVQCLRGEPLTIYGDGTQTRSFCYVDDLLEGLVRMASIKSPPDGPINLGNPGEFTVAELAAIVKKIVGVNNPVRFQGLPSDDPKQRRPDIARAFEFLDWSPNVNLEEGLRKTVDYFRTCLASDAD